MDNFILGWRSFIFIYFLCWFWLHIYSPFNFNWPFSILHFLFLTSQSHVCFFDEWMTLFWFFPIFFFASSLENNLLDINWQFGNMSFHLDSQTMSFFNAILGWTRWLLNATLCASCLHSLIWSRKGHTLMTLCSQTSGADISTVSFKKILKLK